MKKGKSEILLEFLENLEKTVSSLGKLENSVERQTALFHLRSLCFIKKSAVVSEIGATSLLSETIEETRLRILRTLSNLGTESLLDSGERRRSNVQVR